MADTAPPACEPVLCVRQLAVRFETPVGSIDAVRDVSFALAPGRIHALAGESGSGKSATAAALLGLLPAGGHVIGGEVLYDGQNLLTLGEAGLRRLRGAALAAVFQNASLALNPTLRLRVQFEELLRAHEPAALRDGESRYRQALLEAGLGDAAAILRAYPFELSGGQQQRAALALALLLRPRVILADEITSALDPTTQATVLDTVRERARANGVAVLLITHDFGVVERWCDDVTVMYAGRDIESGTVAAVLGRPGHPYTRALLDAVPHLRPELRRPLPELPATGAPPSDHCPFAPRCPRAQADCAASPPPRPVAIAAEHAVACLHPLAAGEVTEGRAELPAAVRSQRGEALLRVLDLEKTYRGGRLLRRAGGSGVRALQRVSLEVAAGECVAVVGESGSGKTTLLRCIAGLEQADGGQIVLDGRPVGGARQRGRARAQAQIVFQNPVASLDPRQRVGSAIEEPLRNLTRLEGQQRQTRVAALLRAVGLPEGYRARLPHQLSGGEAQRVAVARALAPEPALLLLDEPLSGLDVSVQAQVILLFNRLRAELGMAYLFVTHNLSVVPYIADRVIVMAGGQVVEGTTPERLLDGDHHPATQALLAAVPELHSHHEPRAAARDRSNVARGGTP